jgi:DNA helicase II / ATP-dependent DNA helicase PcrA
MSTPTQQNLFENPPQSSHVDSNGEPHFEGMTPMISLNPAQQRIVDHDTGPMLVVAGAGTGKTRVITERILRLIRDGKAKPREILALTFTDKAAEEMEERIDIAMPLSYEGVSVGTFHSFAIEMLRDYGHLIGISRYFELMSTPHQWLWMRERLLEIGLQRLLHLGNPYSIIDSMLRYFSRLKDDLIDEKMFEHGVLTEIRSYGKNSFEDIAPSTSSPMAAGTKHFDDDEELDRLRILVDLSRAYTLYQRTRIRESRKMMLDFGDVLLYLYKLIKESPYARGQIQKRFKYILVDEYQDTNIAQSEILKLITTSDHNLMVVGDDDQSIYAFRGSTIQNIMDFMDDYPGARTEVLDINYRSTSEILDQAYQSIQRNNPYRLETKLGIDKQLTAKRGAGIAPQILHLESLQDEVSEVVDRIIASGLPASSIAILARSHASLDPFERALKRAGIPVRRVGERGYYQRPEISGLLSFFEIIRDLHDDGAMFHLMESPWFEFRDSTILDVMKIARKENYSVIDVLMTMGQRENFSEAELEKLTRIRDFLIQIREVATTESVGSLLLSYIEFSKVSEFYTNQDDEDAFISMQNIQKFFDKIHRFEKENTENGILSFLSYTQMVRDAGEDPLSSEGDEDADAVKLLTIHASKGLEFEMVFVVNMISTRFPARRKSNPFPLVDSLMKEHLETDDPHIEEERRLLYVALTRAKTQKWAKYPWLHSVKIILSMSQMMLSDRRISPNTSQKH